MTELTLVVIKPDGVARGLMGRITQRLEDAGLKIVGMKMLTISGDLAEKHYGDLIERYGQDVFARNQRFMTSGPVVAMVVQGVQAVSAVRKLVGTTDPSESPPGTIRGDFCHQTIAWCNKQDMAVANLVHASGNIAEADQEVALWFDQDELQLRERAYQTAAERFML